MPIASNMGEVSTGMQIDLKFANFYILNSPPIYFLGATSNTIEVSGGV